MCWNLTIVLDLTSELHGSLQDHCVEAVELSEMLSTFPLVVIFLGSIVDGSAAHRSELRRRPRPFVYTMLGLHHGLKTTLDASTRNAWPVITVVSLIAQSPSNP